MYTKTISVLEARRTSQERKTQEHMETKPGQRNTGQRDELAQVEAAAQDRRGWRRFGLWPLLHWERRGLSRVKRMQLGINGEGKN